MSEYYKRKAKFYRKLSYDVVNKKNYLIDMFGFKFIQLPRHPEEWAIAYYYLLCAKDYERKYRNGRKRTCRKKKLAV